MPLEMQAAPPHNLLTTQYKIEFTYQSQTPPKIKVVLEWYKWFLTPNFVHIYGLQCDFIQKMTVRLSY